MKKKNKVGGGLGGMVAAMIPGAEIDQKGRVLVNIATSRETLIFNIGGVNFETYRFVNTFTLLMLMVPLCCSVRSVLVSETAEN